jgi:hypothetical protein
MNLGKKNTSFVPLFLEAEQIHDKVWANIPGLHTVKRHLAVLNMRQK